MRRVTNKFHHNDSTSSSPRLDLYLIRSSFKGTECDKSANKSRHFYYLEIDSNKQFEVDESEEISF